MATKLNMVDCASSINNTGNAPCPLDIEQIVGAIHVPDGACLTKAQLDDLETSIDANINAADIASRWFPVQSFVGVEDKSSDPAIENTPYGHSKLGADSVYHWLFQHDGKLTGHKMLKTFHNKQKDYRAYFIDGKMFENGILIGVQREDGGLDPIELGLLYVNAYKIGGSNGGSGYIGYQLKDSRDMDLRLGFVKLPIGLRPTSIVGLEQTTLLMTSATLTSGGVCTLQLTGETTNLYSRVKTAFPNVLKAYNTSTGAQITSTSITANDTTESFALDLDQTDGDFPASAGMEVTLKWGDMDDITGEDVYGIADCQLVVERA